jgi:hypothetical protein
LLACLVSALIATFALRGSAAPFRRKTFLGTGFASRLACSIWVMTGGVTLTAGTASEPEVGAWPLLVMASMAYGLITFWIAPRRAVPLPTPQPAATVFSPSEPRAWLQTVTVSLFVWQSGGILAGAAALLLLNTREGSTGENLWSAVVLLLTLLPVLAFVRLRISVDSHGLKVVTALLGLSLKTIPLTEIESVHIDALEPLRWGGWGYRIVPGRSAIILRTGPGIVVTLNNGKQFAVSLENPEAPPECHR